MQEELKDMADTLNNLDKLDSADVKEKAQEYCRSMLEKFKAMQPELDYMSMKTEKRNLKKKGISVAHITDIMRQYKSAAIYYAKDKKAEIEELARGFYDKVYEVIPNTTEMIYVTRMSKIGGSLKKMLSVFNDNLEELKKADCASEDIVTFYKSFFDMIFDAAVKYSDIELKKNQERKDSLIEGFEKKLEDMANGVDTKGKENNDASQEAQNVQE